MYGLILSVFLAVALVGPTARAHEEFSFGIATSAMQVEGAWLEDGKTLTAWDNFAHTLGMVADNSTADVAADSYHRFREDIAIMKEYGIKHYRMSIAWTRVLPAGVAGSKVNMKTVAHYRAFLSALKEAGIVAYANIFHNDIPAILAINGSGKADEEFPMHYANFADICFQLFGDLVPYWFTFDEPWCQSVYERAQPYEANTKPYIIAHNLLLAHSEAVYIYRTKYQKKFGGKIGANMMGEMAWPFDPKKQEDVDAAERNRVFQIGWFLDPIFNGDYPELMKKVVGDRLPKFTEEQKAKLKGSIDFCAMNHYYSYLVKQGRYSRSTSYWADVNVTKIDKPEWKRTDMDWPVAPEGMSDLLLYVYNTWVKKSPMEIWITENGVAVKEPDVKASLNDTDRIEFTYGYLAELGKVKAMGVPVTKYFTWSLLDNFEWGSGLAKRFGLTRIEYGANPRRIPKSSMLWYSQLLSSTQ